jgi:glutathione S-transferase
MIFHSSRVIMTYLVSAYGKDDKLYPKDPRTRALVDHRLHFDLGTLYQRMTDYFVSFLFIQFPVVTPKFSSF